LNEDFIVIRNTSTNKLDPKRLATSLLWIGFISGAGLIVCFLGIIQHLVNIDIIYPGTMLLLRNIWMSVLWWTWIPITIALLWLFISTYRKANRLLRDCYIQKPSEPEVFGFSYSKPTVYQERKEK